MPKVLLVKMSSMGDLVHNLPVASDIAARFPGAQIDWVAEEDYAPIPALHPQVRAVIPIAWRRWRKQLGAAAVRHEMAEFYRRLRSTRYDFVLDTQGLLKSAAVACMAHGVRVGGDRASIKEPLAAMFYQRRLPIAWSRHVIDRCRAVAAGALGYALDTPPDLAIAAPPLVADWLPDTAYSVLMHAASRPEKLWPEEHWIALGRHLASCGQRIVLPWGSPDEAARSRRLAAAIPGALVPPRMGLATVAEFLAGSKIVVGLDTGFTHLAAALGRPTVGIYCDSDGAQAAVFGRGYCKSLGRKGQPPDYPAVLAAATTALESLT